MRIFKIKDTRFPKLGEELKKRGIEYKHSPSTEFAHECRFIDGEWKPICPLGRIELDMSGTKFHSLLSELFDDVK